MRIRIVIQHLNQTSFTTQTNIASSILHCRVPIEMWTDKTIVLRVVGKCLQFWIINRQTILGGNPQAAITILNNTFHAIIYQTIFLCQHFKALITILIQYAFIESVSVTTQPQSTIAGFAERRNLINDFGCRIGQKMADIASCKLSILL